MDIHAVIQQLNDTRQHAHTLAGLIAALSYGLHCAKLSHDLESAVETLASVENVVSEVEDVVATMRVSLRDVANNLDCAEQ